MVPFCREPYLHGVAILLKVAGVIGLLAFLFRAFGRSPREGVCLALLLAFLLTYPAVLFSIRNFFYLEFVSWLGLLSIMVLPVEWRRITHAKQQFALWVIGVAALTTAVYGGLSVFQDRALTRQISGLLALPREAMTTDPPSDEEGGAVWRLPLPETLPKPSLRTNRQSQQCAARNGHRVGGARGRRANADYGWRACLSRRRIRDQLCISQAT